MTGYVCDGTSLTFGLVIDTGTTVTPYPSQLAALTGLPAINVGESGAQSGYLDTNYATRTGSQFSATTANVLIVEVGINDIYNGGTVATIDASIRSYCAKARATGFKVYLQTITPSNGYGWTSGWESIRQAVNTDRRSNWASYCDGLIDTAANPALSNTADGTHYQSDQLHWTTLTDSIVAGMAQSSTATASSSLLHPEKIGIGAFEGGDPYDLPGGGTSYTQANDVILFNALKNMGFRCYHTWHPPALTGDDNSVVRLPAWWGAGDLTANALASIKANGNLVIGSNEPWSGHFGSTVDECIAVWPSLMALGNRLAAPSISSWDPGSSDPWIDDFMTKIAAHGYRVDAQNVHFYTRTSDPTAATNEFLTYLNGIHARYPMPMIVTEWGLNNFGATGTSRSEYVAGVPQPHSMAQQIAFMQAAIPMLDSLSFVEKHFWYALTYDGSYDNYALMLGNQSLTPLGQSFSNLLGQPSLPPPPPPPPPPIPDYPSLRQIMNARAIIVNSDHGVPISNPPAGISTPTLSAMCHARGINRRET